MKTNDEILFVSSYPPREGETAKYTQDLMFAIKEKFGSSYSLSVCALENQVEFRPYGKEVKYILHTENYVEYLDMARRINEDSNISTIVVHHEFSLFSGEYGENLLYFLYDLNKPIIVHFNTIFPNPDHRMIYIVNAIITVSAGILVKSEQAKNILIREYEIEPEKIYVMQYDAPIIGTRDISIRAQSLTC